MQDEAQEQGQQGEVGESPEDFFARAFAEAEADGDGDDSGASEEDADGDEDVQATGEEDDPSEDVDDDGEEEPAPKNNTISKLTLKLRDREKELTTLRAEARALQEEVKRLSDVRREQTAEPDDIVDHVRSIVVRKMGLKADDPRLKEVMNDLVADLTAEFVEGADAIDAFKDRKSARAKRLAEESKYRQVTEQIEQMKREKEEAQLQAAKANDQQVVTQFLTSNMERFPFLMDQTQVNPAEYILEAAVEAINTGAVPRPATRQDAQDLMDLIATNADAEYRALAEKLATRLGKGATVKSEQSKAKKHNPTKRTGTASGTGGGGRGAPTPRQEEQESADEDAESFIRRRINRDLALKRKRR